MWKGYTDLPAAGYIYRATIISAGGEHSHEVIPRVHHVASLLKRWWRGTLQGGVQPQHLGYSLDAFTFRFNHPRSHARGLRFHHLAQQAITVGPASYGSIVRGESVRVGLYNSHPRGLVDQLFCSSEMRLVQLLPLMAHFGKDDKLETVIPKICQDTLAEMISTMRARFFMNTFRTLGFL